MEGGAAARHLVHGGLDNRLDDLGGQAVRRPRKRRICAHPAGVRSGVAVPDPLVVLGGQQGNDGSGFGNDREQGDLWPVQVLLDHDPVARIAQAGVYRADRGLPVGGDGDALARGETVVLDDVWRAELVEIGEGGLDLGVIT